MDFWLYWVWIWVFLFVLEMFVWTFDLLALWLAAFTTSFLVYFLWLWFDQRQISWIIFLIASIIAIMLTRILVAPRVSGMTIDSPMSSDSIVWRKFSVEEINERNVIKYEWMYRNITSESPISWWDMVVVLSLDDNLVVVKKIS